MANIKDTHKGLKGPAFRAMLDALLEKDYQTSTHAAYLHFKKYTISDVQYRILMDAIIEKHIYKGN